MNPNQVIEELQASRKRLVLTADADRRQLERELHDGVQQDLVAIVVKLQLARRLADSDPTGAAALLDEIRHDAQAALDATRALALRIHPPLLDAPGLRAALRAAAPETDVEVAVGAGCPEETVACAYFCCLELLPGASAVCVHEDGDAIVFEVAISQGSPDLTRLQDRVEAFGGRVTAEPGRVVGVLPA